jgi:hypothetical protein
MEDDCIDCVNDSLNDKHYFVCFINPSLMHRCSTKCLPEEATLEQTQKIIQNVVRVPSSLYTMNLASLTVYRPLGFKMIGWNQMSDRLIPSIQKSKTSLKSSKSSRPGALTPGGVGCDIKHNSYDRYLAKMKGKYLRGTSATDIHVFGGKKMKLNLVSGCICEPN